jgi:hypothetical protein
MSAIAALEAARAAGVRLKVEGDDLVLEACEEPPSSLLELVSLNKVGIVTMLRPGCDGWSADDWFAFFDERAGIAEFDGGLTRPEAEARAFECCIVEWLNRNAMHSPPGQCLGCGGCEYAHDPLLPYGIESFGQMWLHSRCWPRTAVNGGFTGKSRAAPSTLAILLLRILFQAPWCSTIASTPRAF